MEKILTCNKITLKEFFDQWQERLLLEVDGSVDLAGSRPLQTQLHWPGLELAGHWEGFSPSVALMLDAKAMGYLRGLEAHERQERLSRLIDETTPFVLLGGGQRPLQELVQRCALTKTPILVSSLEGQRLFVRLVQALESSLAPCCELHATCVSVWGLGVLLRGSSAVGKSQTALKLLARGHRLVSDDLVLIKQAGQELLATSYELTRGYLEVRGVGVIDVTRLHGEPCLQLEHKIDLVIELIQDPFTKDSRPIADASRATILGIERPLYQLPCGRNGALELLVEAIVAEQIAAARGRGTPEGLRQRIESTMQQRSKDKNCFT